MLRVFVGQLALPWRVAWRAVLSQVLPTEPLEKARAFNERLLKISTEARRLGMALRGQKISKDPNMMAQHDNITYGWFQFGGNVLSNG